MSYISHVKVGNTTYDIKDNEAARINSPQFTGTPKAPLPSSSATTQIATVGYVNDAFKANDAMIFKGTIGSSGATVTTLPTTHYQGWTYKVATTGSYAGQNCEPGDMIICITDGTTANNEHWTVVQNNMTYSNAAPSDLDNIASAGSSAMVARADHVHKKPNLGNITYEGKISATTQIGSGDKILISDFSDSNIIKNTSINFDGSSEDKALTPKGTWGDFYTEPEIDEKLDEKENLIAKNASGSIAHFEDGLEAPAIDVKVDIEPMQDLHGYDHPWPAGGGKNLLTFTPKTGTNNGVTFTWKKDGTVTVTGVVTSGQSNAQQNVPINLPSGNYYYNGGVDSNVYCYIWSSDNSRAKKWDGSTASDTSINNSLLEIKIEDNKSYYFVCYVKNTTPSGTYTLKPMICASTETDNSFEPYSNICPISGFSEIKILKTGKNLFDKDHAISGLVINNNGTIQTGYQTAVLSDYIPIKNGICTFSSISIVPNNNPDNTLRIGLYDENKNFIRREISNIAYQNNYHIIKINDPLVKYVRCNVFMSSDNIDTVQLELNTEQTEYEPFGNIYSVSFENAGTVYKGNLDVDTGKLTVTHNLWSSTQNQSITSPISVNGLTRYWLYVGQKYKTVGYELVCDTLKYKIYNPNEVSVVNNTIGASANYPYSLTITMPTALVGTTVASINTYLASNPFNVVLQLATPVTYQLTPRQIDILLNINNIWSDAGNISIDYWKNKKIAECIEEKNNIVINTASGNVASFNSTINIPTADLIVEIKPAQDLHGYLYPYPAGHGKNLYSILCGNDSFMANNNATFTKSDNIVVITPIVGNYNNSGIYFSSNSVFKTLLNSLINEGKTATISFDAKTNITGTSIRYCGSLSNEAKYATLTTNWTRLSYNCDKNFTHVFYGNNLTQSATISIKNVMISIDESTSYEPYENICPITEYTETNITKIRANFLETKPRVKTYETMTVTVNDNGSITLNGTTGSVDYIYCYNLADPTGVNGRQNDNKKHIPNGSYIKSIDSDWVLQVFGSNVENAGADDSVLIAYTSDNFIIDDTYKYNWCRLLLRPNRTFNNITIYPYIYKSDEAILPWESYNATTYPISFESIGKIYGGNLNVNSGLLTVTHNIACIGTSLSAYSNGLFAFNVPSKKIGKINILSDTYKTVEKSTGSLVSGEITGGIADHAIYFKDNRFTSLAEAKTGLQNSYVIYELTTPYIYQLTPIEITILFGQNNIWCDTGDIIVNYWEDKNIAEYVKNTIKQIDYKNNKNANIITNNISNTIATFNDGTNTPVVDLIAKIEPFQSGTGDPSSSNIRPILGWNKCNITRGSKNLIQRLSSSTTLNGLTFTVNNDDSITVTGTASKATYYHFANVDTSKVNIGDILCGCPDGGGSTTYELQLDVDNQLGARDYGNGNNLPVTQLGTNNRIYICIKNGVTINAVFRPMIFHANEYSRTSISFGSAGTVYGGSLNVNTGILTVDRASYTVNENTEIGYFVPSTTYGAYGQITVSNSYFDANEATVISSSCKSVSQVGRLVDAEIDRCFTDGENYISLRASKNSGITTKEELKAHFMGTQLVYSLATPLTYQLTPTEVTTLLGQNTIFVDTGAVDVTYRADTKTYVDEKIESSVSESETATRTMITQSSESAMVATKNYNTGDLFIVNNQLLRATSAIATTQAITIGTNAEVVDLDTVISEKVSTSYLNNLISANQYFKIVAFDGRNNIAETFTIGTAARVVVFVLDSSAQNLGAYIIVSSGGGSVSNVPILSASNISLTSPSSGKITITKVNNTNYKFGYIALVYGGQFTLDS